MTWIDSLLSRLRPSRRAGTDYPQVVEHLIKTHGRAKAMEMAVGGGIGIGEQELVILDHFGLRDGHYLIDVGCGSGRLTRAAAGLPKLRYLGTDVSKPLIDHARTTCGREDFRFAVVDKIAIPAEDQAADFVSFFSVGTHLMVEEFFVYLEEARRVLKPGGRIVFSFLDLSTPGARATFDTMVEKARQGVSAAPINVFFGADTVRIWAEMLGIACVEIVLGKERRWSPSERIAGVIGADMQSRPFGQSLAVLEKSRAGAAGEKS